MQQPGERAPGSSANMPVTRDTSMVSMRKWGSRRRGWVGGEPRAPLQLERRRQGAGLMKGL